jgi:dTDP-3-amino-3,4,6-trideoxy-alpha-D-glucose transaminase
MILLNDFQRQWAETGADVLQAVEAVGASGWYILGQNVVAFERHLAEYWRMPHAIGVASGLDAIELALRALGCGPGDFVLTSPISAFATALAIVKVGATPVFADSDGCGLIDLEEAARILGRHPEIRYFVPVHLYGHSLDLDRLRQLRDQYGLKIVEDCAQSIGAGWGGSPTGSVGQFAATSFYPTKNLGALGDGGAVLTADEQGAATIRKLRDYGQSAKYRHDLIGYNSRLDELQAAILNRAFLPRLAQWTMARRRIAAAYREGIRNPALRIPGAPGNSESCWHLFPVLVAPERKQEAMAHFRSRSVSVAEHYPLALADQAALRGIDWTRSSSCARAREFCASEISLPIHPYLNEAEIDAVIRAANEWS